MHSPLFPDDRALAKRLTAGDDRAFEVFFTEYFPRLYRFAMSRAPSNPSLVEDVVQESLTAALEQIHHYRGEAALFSWLCTICRRTLSRRERSDRRERSLQPYPDEDKHLRPATESIEDEGPHADSLLILEERRRAVHQALDALPERYARALEWKYLEDLGVADIAKRLGISVKAAESILTRARAALRDAVRTLAGPPIDTRGRS